MKSFHSTITDQELDAEFKSNLEHRSLEQKFSYIKESAAAYYNKKHLKSAYMSKPSQTLQFNDYLQFVKKTVSPSEKTVIIVLGCGNMNQEIKILKKLGGKYNIDLIGVDSSKAMLDLARKTLKKNNIKQILMHSDFTKQEFRKSIEKMTKNYQKRIFSFTGGTLTNVNQTAIADSLYNLLNKKDILWVDTVLRKSLKKTDDIKNFNAIYSLTKNPARVNFWTLPLKRAGIPLDAGSLTMNTSEESSVGVMKFTISFKFKKLVKIKYKNEVIHFSKNDTIDLRHFRLYHAPTFIIFFKDHGFKLLDKHLAVKMGQFMFKKMT